MATTSVGPLNAVLIDPLNRDHVMELTKQRIDCGWHAEQVPEMMSEIVDGKRQHFLYYESTTGLPVGSGAITSVAHLGPISNGDLPEGSVTLCAGFIYPQHRGKGFASYSHNHRQSLAFSDPSIQRVVIDTLSSFTKIREWHTRMGYTQYGLHEQIRVFAAVEDIPPQLRTMSTNLDDFIFVFSEMTRETWKEMVKQGRKTIERHNEKGGIPSELKNPLKYTDEEVMMLLEGSQRLVV